VTGRNVLFVTADQWRGDCVSALGHATVRTPHLDAFARRGVLFSAHYCQAAPCGPSRASLHTGLYLMNHRSVTNGTPLDRRHVNWAQLARAAGYDPVLFGYTDTSVDPRDYAPGDPALTTYEGVLPGLRPKVLVNSGNVGPWAAWLATQGYEIPPHAPDLYRQRAAGPDWEDGAAVPAPLAIRHEHHDTRFLTDHVIDYVHEHRHESWCVHLSLLRPHPPWIAPEPYNTMYPPDALPAFVRAASVEGEARQHPWLAFQLGREGIRVPASEKRLRRLQASYYGLMSEVDDNLGRLFAALEASGRADETLVVFTSDHGEQMGDHHLLGKHGYFEQSFRVPLVIQDPRSTADATRGSVVRRFTENVDVMPTLLDWLGLPLPAACDGGSLIPFLRSLAGPERWRDAAHWEYDFRDSASALDLPEHACNLAVLRASRWKYVHFAALPPLLFDLDNDPSELDDLAGDPACQSVLLECMQRMLTFRMRHADQTLTHLTLTPKGVVSRPAARW